MGNVGEEDFAEPGVGGRRRTPGNFGDECLGAALVDIVGPLGVDV